MQTFTLSKKELKSSFLVSAASSAGLLVVAGILGAVAVNDGADLLIAVAVGLAVGGLARSFAVRGWRAAQARVTVPTRIRWSAKRRLGLAWRSAIVFFAGQLVISALDQMAWSDASQLVLMYMALLAITEAASLMGLRFGWHAAQDELATQSA